MSHFDEGNTVEQMVLDTLAGGTTGRVAEQHDLYAGEIKGWRFIPAESLPRQHSAVFVEDEVRDAPSRLNPEIKAQPERADEVLYRLRTIPLSVRSNGLVCLLCLGLMKLQPLVALIARDSPRAPKLAPLVREMGWAMIHLLSLGSEVRYAA